jgi:hypothetical protein
MDEHDPQSALECELVERLAAILWRLRRVPSFEAAILNLRHYQVWYEDDYGDPCTTQRQYEDEPYEVHCGIALMHGNYGDTLGKIGRHETLLMNAFAKTLQALRLLQLDRTNNKDDTTKLKVIALPPAARL